jgi:hypothetical protein
MKCPLPSILTEVIILLVEAEESGAVDLLINHFSEVIQKVC